MTLQDIKETKRYGRTDARTDAHTHTDNVKTVYPPQTKFAGGIKMVNKTNLKLSEEKNFVLSVHTVNKGITVLKIFIWGGISSDIRSEI